MVEYSCKKCGKLFKQKGHYTKHLQRKTPCNIVEDNLDKIVEEKVNKVINEKLTQENITISKLKKFI